MIKKLLCSLFGHRWGHPDSLTPHIMCQRCRLHRTLPQFRTLDPVNLPLAQDEVAKVIDRTLERLGGRYGPSWEDLEREYIKQTSARFGIAE